MRIPYLEARKHDIGKVVEDINRLKSVLGNTKSLDAVKGFLEGEIKGFSKIAEKKHMVIIGSLKKRDRTIDSINMLENGAIEKSIIKINREHYTAVHPTQKPVKLLERLIMLCLPDKPREEVTIADYFGGSFSTAEAALNLGCSVTVCEIDEEYFNLGNSRILRHLDYKIFEI